MANRMSEVDKMAAQMALHAKQIDGDDVARVRQMMIEEAKHNRTSSAGSLPDTPESPVIDVSSCDRYDGRILAEAEKSTARSFHASTWMHFRMSSIVCRSRAETIPGGWAAAYNQQVCVE